MQKDVGRVEAYLVVFKCRNDSLTFPELDFSILKQPRDRTSGRAENVKPREVDKAPRPGALDQRAGWADAQSLSHRCD